MHIIPRTLETHGLSKKQLKFSKTAIRKMIQEYTREAGVRSLERCLSSICRKVATKIVTRRTRSVKVTPELVTSYLGPAKVVRDSEGIRSQIGIVTGLAWTETGGETLSVEVNIMPGKGKMQLTGQLGDVMKESAQAAFSYIRSHTHDLGIDPGFQENIDVHVHIPEGAIPKDGPSAGVALSLALISAVTKKPVRGDVAMTGEITLRGRILTIGGLKEKLLAALRAGIKTVLFPRQNEKDLEEIPDYVKDKLQLLPVRHLDEVLEIAFTPRSRKIKPKAPRSTKKVEPASRGRKTVAGKKTKSRSTTRRKR